MNPDLYRIAYDFVEEIITFFLYNLSGQLVGYQQYRPGNDQKKKRNDEDTGRYFTHTTKAKTDDGTLSMDGVFGLEIVPDLTTAVSDRPLYVVEGIFKAGVLHRLGFDSIAVLTSHPKRMKSFFRMIKPLRPVIAIGDNDEGGRKLVKFIGAGFTTEVDLDEMSDCDIVKLLGE